MKVKSTSNVMRCNNRDDLHQLSFTLKISIFSEAYINNPVEHLWWGLYYGNSKPLSVFTKSSIVDARLGSKYVSHFWRIFKSFISWLLKSVISLKYFASYNSSNLLLNPLLIIEPFDLLNTIPLIRTKTFVNNLLMSKF